MNGHQKRGNYSPCSPLSLFYQQAQGSSQAPPSLFSLWDEGIKVTRMKGKSESHSCQTRRGQASVRWACVTSVCALVTLLVVVQGWDLTMGTFLASIQWDEEGENKTEGRATEWREKGFWVSREHGKWGPESSEWDIWVSKQNSAPNLPISNLVPPLVVNVLQFMPYALSFYVKKTCLLSHWTVPLMLHVHRWW